MVASCELLNEPLPGALEGRYTAIWTFSGLDSRGAPVLPDVSCEGGFRIEEASDSILTGSYTIRSSDDCSVASGPLSGSAREDGGISVEAGRIDVQLGECALNDVQLSLNGIGNRHVFEIEGESPARCANPVIADSIPITTLRVHVYANHH